MNRRILNFVVLVSVMLATTARAQHPSTRRPGGANASFTVREFKGSNGQTLRYSLFVPKSLETALTKLPVVLCLHGAGGNTAAANALADPDVQKKHTCVVVAPAVDGTTARWVEAPLGRGRDARPVVPELLECLDSIVKEFSIDPARIYVTGQSMGGVGTWGLLAKHADRFAAAIPVCGIWSPDDAPKMNGVAIWAFHGDKDPTVPVSGSRNMIEALKKAGVKPEAKYSELAGVGHGSWTPAYATPELWDWLFAQRRQTGASKE
jgi:predicted peptidase